MTSDKAQEIFAVLKKHYPQAKMLLEWGNNFELLVSIILSAQCTDKKVNEVTSRVFPKYRQKREEFETYYKQYSEVILSTAEDLSLKDSGQVRMTGGFASHYQNYTRIELPKEQVIEIVNFAFVPLEELEQDIKSTGFYHNKAVNVQKAARVVLDKFSGILPQTIAELTTIPGVGRKTANVFLGNAYGIYEGIAVDTHVTKQSQVLGLTKNADPIKIEQDLMQLFPQDQWFTLTYLLIEHGRTMRRKKSDRTVCGDNECILCKEK